MGVLRWPGGQLRQQLPLDRRHRPKDERPRRPELAWGWRGIQPLRHGRVHGPTAAARHEPYVCLNMGTGTLDEALAWVEYCNGAGGTAWAQRRRTNGHPEPYGVRYWGLGNEIVRGLAGWRGVGRGVRPHRDPLGRAIKMLDRRPAGQLRDERLEPTGTGWSSTGWLPGRLHHSLHIYTGSDDYWTDVLQPHQAERAIRLRPGADRAGVVRT